MNIDNPIFYEADDYYDREDRTLDQMENDGLRMEIDNLTEKLQDAHNALRRIYEIYYTAAHIYERPTVHFTDVARKMAKIALSEINRGA